MNKKIQQDKEIRNVIKNLIYNEKSNKEIAKILKIDEWTIGEIVNELGLKNKWKEIKESRILEEVKKLLADNRRYCEISKMLNISISKISMLVKKNNCGRTKEQIVKSRIETNLKKYGCKNPKQNEKIKQKGIETNLKKYGAKYPLQNKKIKQDFIQKQKNKNKGNFYFQTEDFKEKSEKKYYEKYGIKNNSELKSLKIKEEYENKIFTNYQGCKFKVIKYENANNVLIEFQDEHKCKKNTFLEMIKKGQIKNPYCPSVYGVGYIGDERIKTREKVGNGKYNGKHTKEYEAWRSILQRCYDKKYLLRRPTYKGCMVCKEWLCFSNFYNWVIKEPNYEKWKIGNRWAVDKDIIVKGNKIYSPDTCCLVPNYINIVFTKKKCKKEKEEIIQLAEQEYKKKNISEKCYIAMKNKVE